MKNIFIGGINIGNHPRGGEDAKNQQILQFFNKKKIKVKVIDTYNWKRKTLTIISKIINICLFSNNTNIYLSIHHHSAFQLIRLLSIIGILKRNKVHYFVVGGVFHEWLKKNSGKIKYYTQLKGIYPETREMTQTLEGIGLKNIKEVPNFKHIPQIEIKKDYQVIKFLFLSRVSPLKGTNQILEAVENLNLLGLSNKFLVDFYGAIDSDYKNSFMKQCNNLLNVNYKGYIDLNNKKNYETLSIYNMMLFPSFWPGEGFPGVFIDAFIANIPILASDWNHNKEIISHGINGLIIPVKDVQALTNTMKNVINNPEFLKKLEEGVKKTKHNYDIEEVLANIIEQN